MSSRAERRAVQDAQRAAKALAGLTDAACEIVLVRHGETQWNVEQRLQGQLVPGPGLTGRGRQQAAVLAARLQSERFDCAYSSDLLRATETADIVAGGLLRSGWSNGCTAAGDCGGGCEGGGAGAAAVSGCCTGGEGCSAGGQQAAARAGHAADEVGAAGADVQLDPQLRERHLGLLQGLTRAEAAELHPEAYRALSEPGLASVGGLETLEQLEARAEQVLEELAARHPGQRLLVVTHGGFLSAAYKRAAGHPLFGKNVNAAINTLRIDAAAAPGQAAAAGRPAGGAAAAAAPGGTGAAGQRRQAAWAVVRWGDADHLQGVGALASAFGGGTAG
ncbi:hypothetical protein ABPG75_002227 [Micractinium tetrahymenae]